MSPLRKEALQLVESVPEENLLGLIKLIRSEIDEQTAYKERLARNRKTLDDFLKLCKPVPDLDYDKAREEYMREKFGNANLG